MDAEVQQSLRELQEQFLAVDPAFTGTLASTDFVFILLRNGSSREQAATLLQQFAVDRAPGKVNYQNLLRHLSRVAEGAAAVAPSRAASRERRDKRTADVAEEASAVAPERMLFASVSPVREEEEEDREEGMRRGVSAGEWRRSRSQSSADPSVSPVSSIGTSAATRSASARESKEAGSHHRSSMSNSNNSRYAHQEDEEAWRQSREPWRNAARSLFYASPITPGSDLDRYQSPLSPSPSHRCAPVHSPSPTRPAHVGREPNPSRDATAAQQRRRSAAPSPAIIAQALRAAREASATRASTRTAIDAQSEVRPHGTREAAALASEVARAALLRSARHQSVAAAAPSLPSHGHWQPQLSSPPPRNPAMTKAEPSPRHPLSSPSPPSQQNVLDTAVLLDSDEVREPLLPLRPPPPLPDRPPARADGETRPFSLKDVFRMLSSSPAARVVPVSAVCAAFASRKHLDVSAEELEALADALDLAVVDGEAQLTLADFCLIISRLRPSQIQRVRCAASWRAAPLGDDAKAKDGPVERRAGAAESTSLPRPPHRAAPPPPQLPPSPPPADVRNFYTRPPPNTLNVYESTPSVSGDDDGDDSDATDASFISVSPLKPSEMPGQQGAASTPSVNDSDAPRPRPLAAASPQWHQPDVRQEQQQQQHAFSLAPPPPPRRASPIDAAAGDRLAELEQEFHEKYGQYLRSPRAASTAPTVAAGKRCATPDAVKAEDEEPSARTEMQRHLQPTATSRAHESQRKAPAHDRRVARVPATSSSHSPAREAHEQQQQQAAQTRRQTSPTAAEGQRHPSWSPPASARKPIVVPPKPAHVKQTQRLRSRVAQYAEDVRQRNARAISEERQEREARRAVAAAKRAIRDAEADGKASKKEGHVDPCPQFSPSPSPPMERRKPLTVTLPTSLPPKRSASAPSTHQPPRPIRMRVSLASLHDSQEPAAAPAPTQSQQQQQNSSTQSVLLSQSGDHEASDAAATTAPSGAARAARDARATMMGGRRRAATQPPPAALRAAEQPVARVFRLRSPPQSAHDASTSASPSCQPEAEASATPERWPCTGEDGAPSLPQEVLLKLRGKSSALLSACTRLDRHRDGCLSFASFAKALSTAVPALTIKEAEGFLRWSVQSAGTAHNALPYARLVGNVLAAEALCPSPETASATRPPAAAAPSTPSKTAAAGATVSTSAPALPTGKSPKAHDSQLAELRRRAREGREQLRHLLHAELSQTAGGDTDALCDFFFTHFDDAHTGYLEEPELREALERLFVERAHKPIPPWLLEQCVLTARTPFAREATRERSGGANGAEEEATTEDTSTPPPPPETQAEAEARARVHRIPRLLWPVMCDYRYLFEELDL